MVEIVFAEEMEGREGFSNPPPFFETAVAFSQRILKSSQRTFDLELLHSFLCLVFLLYWSARFLLVVPLFSCYFQHELHRGVSRAPRQRFNLWEGNECLRIT